MSIDPSEFRRVLGRLVTGVTVVATRIPQTGEPCGLTVNALTSLSLEPSLVLVCVERAADSHDCIRETGHFSVNVLASGQERLARRFAFWKVEDKFEGVAHHVELTGSPVLDEALAWVDCRVWAVYAGGDHTIFVGEVVAGDALEGSPLLYYRSGYGRFVS